MNRVLSCMVPEPEVTLPTRESQPVLTERESKQDKAIEDEPSEPKIGID